MVFTYKYSVSSCERIVAYRELASGHVALEQRPVRLNLFRHNVVSFRRVGALKEQKVSDKELQIISSCCMVVRRLVWLRRKARLAAVERAPYEASAFCGVTKRVPRRRCKTPLVAIAEDPCLISFHPLGEVRGTLPIGGTIGCRDSRMVRKRPRLRSGREAPLSGSSAPNKREAIS